MNKILIIMLALVFGTSAYAQEKEFGIRFGYLNSSMNDVNGNNYGRSQDGFFVGAYNDTKMLPFLYLQTGLEYTQMGTEKGVFDYKVHYLGVPAALKVKIGPLFAFGGAAFNVRLTDNDNPFGDNNKWYDTNAFAGVGFELLVFTVDAKYIWGLTDVNEGLNNDGFQIGVGLRF